MSPEPRRTGLRSDGPECPRCGASLEIGKIRCSRCGARLPEAVDALREEGDRRRRADARRKGTADLLFLAGLLLGGPLLSFGIRPGAGLFLILGGGFASVLRRYTAWSTLGTLLVGALSAATVAAAVMDADASDGSAGEDPGATVRESFVSSLSDRWSDRDIRVESRGLESRIVWIRLPPAEQEECGGFPPSEVREHLRGLGVRRLVVPTRRSDGGLCSFAP